MKAQPCWSPDELAAVHQTARNPKASASLERMEFSWNRAAIAAGVTALVLLFPLPGSVDCAELGSSGCQPFYESVLVRYKMSYFAAAGIAIGIAVFVGAALHFIGRLVFSNQSDRKR